MNRQKDKGDRAERFIVKELQALGLEAQRVPLSGAAGGKFVGDIVLEVPGIGKRLGEVKVRKDAQGFRLIEKWLREGLNDYLFLKRDYGKPFVVLTWDSFAELMNLVVQVDIKTWSAEDVQRLFHVNAEGDPNVSVDAEPGEQELRLPGVGRPDSEEDEEDLPLFRY